MAETMKKTKAPAKPRSKAAKTAPITEMKVPAKPRAAAKPTLVAEKAAVPTPTRDQIALLAHRFWAERGYRHGSAEQDWFRAEQQLRGMAS